MHSVGINVNRVRIISMILSGLMAALGGAYMTLGYASIFSKDMVAGRGWIGIAAQGIAGTSYLVLLLISMIFLFFRLLQMFFFYMIYRVN